MIKAARRMAGLTQDEAARLVFASHRAWQEWEAGRRRMPPAVWVLFLAKIGGGDEVSRQEMLSRADIMRRVTTGLESTWWTGYLRGLRRYFYGEAFGTDEEHERYMTAGGDPSRKALQAGYKAGLTGQWAEPFGTEPFGTEPFGTEPFGTGEDDQVRTKKTIVRGGDNDGVCVCTYEEGANGFRLIKAENDKASHLIGHFFPDLEALKRAVLSAVFGEQNVLDKVMISPEAYRQWLSQAQEAINKFGRDINPDDIPDEQAWPQADGSLLIWVDLPNGERVSMMVPKGQWRFL